MRNKIELYVFDLDDTIADSQHRKHYICNDDGTEKDTKDWKRFFAACSDDVPIKHTINLLHAIALKRETLNPNVFILILTARSEAVREQTEEWIELYVGSYFVDMIEMRPVGNHEQDDTLKPRQLKQIIERMEGEGEREVEVMAIFEDRKRVVDAWRALGHPTFQVADGNF